MAACLHDKLPDRWYRSTAPCPCGKPHRIVEHELEAHGTLRAAAHAHQVKPNTVTQAWAQQGLKRLQPGPPPKQVTSGGDYDDERILQHIKKARARKVDPLDLADQLDLSPRRVREAIVRLREQGFRIDDTGGISLERVAPDVAQTVTTVTPQLFDGKLLRVGVVSDTHLGAHEQALEELECAYDVFDKEGIREVWHAGDWGTGVGMFKTHHAEAHVHTAPEQVAYLVDHYPRRKRIITRGIAGNHDIEGDFGRIGFDPIHALAQQRPDIQYLGPYGAWLELRPGTGSHVHLLHGSGGMSYAVSYKAQKLVDGYPAARKPNALIVGHWHVRGDFLARGVHVLFPGCFEWQSRFMQRLGLQPAVGFHILELWVADDGSIVRWRPEWRPFYPGRKVAAA